MSNLESHQARSHLSRWRRLRAFILSRSNHDTRWQSFRGPNVAQFRHVIAQELAKVVQLSLHSRRQARRKLVELTHNYTFRVGGDCVHIGVGSLDIRSIEVHKSADFGWELLRKGHDENASVRVAHQNVGRSSFYFGQ